MILRRIRRKLHKMTHPVVAEVWMLHRVVSNRSHNPRERTLEITPEWLRETVAHHFERGGTFVSPDALMQTLAHPVRQKQPTAVVTFDEGCRETLHHILPFFEQYQIPFLLFVTTDFVGGKQSIEWYDRKPEMMSWEELATLCQHPLCTIGAHTVSHPHLCQIATQDAQREIEQSKHILEEHLHQSIRYFSYPYGERNQTVRQMVQQSGYCAAFEAWGGATRTGDDPYDLPRIPIIQPDR